MTQMETLQNVTAEENITICPECKGQMEHKGDEVFCTKCGFILD